MQNFSVEYFVQLLSNVFENSIDDNEVWNWLEMAVEKVETDYLTVQARCEETGYHEESPQEIDLGLTALETYRESLGLLEEYLQMGDESLLEEAAEKAVAVHQMFQQAVSENEAMECEEVLDFSF